MQPSLMLYIKLLILFLVLTGVTTFHLAWWGLHRYPVESEWHVPVADAQRGKVMIQQYGCGACHRVPGIREATGRVGPRLDRLREQVYIAGVLPNNPQNLVFWIQNPQKADPPTVMPNLNVREEDARDIAAYLYGLP